MQREIALAIFATIIVFFVVMTKRIHDVTQLRKEILEKVSRRSDKLIEQGKYLEWPRLFKTLADVSFDAQVWKIWKDPIDFYPPEFLREIGYIKES